MRIRSVAIECFGVFRQRGLEFAPGLQVVFGPNEAGKSTLLQLLREVLFGFPQRSPYVFAEHDAEMAASARLVLASGEEIEFRRRKGIKTPVEGRFASTGLPLREADLARCLGGAGPELFSHVFAFSLHELARGEESLRDAKLDQALYGGALGGLGAFQQLLADLRAQEDDLFKPRGRASEIHQMLAKVRQTETALRDKAIKPRDYEQLRERLARLEADAAAAGERVADGQRRVAHLGRLRRAWPKWHELRATRVELTALADAPDLPPTAGDDFAALVERARELDDEARALRGQRDQAREDAQSEAPDLEFLKRKDAIRGLLHEVGKIQGFERDLPQRRHDAAVASERVLRRLRELHPHWDLRHLERYEVGLAERVTLDRLADELRGLEENNLKLDARLVGLRDDSKRDAGELAALEAAPDDSALEAVVELEADHKALGENRAALRAEAARCQAARHRLGLALESVLGGPCPDELKLPLPLAAEVANFREEFAQRAKSRESAELKQRLADDEREQAAKALEELDAREQIPSPDDLLELRRQRDEGWRVLRRRYVEPVSDQAEAERDVEAWLRGAAPAGAASPAAAFEVALRECDRVADEHQEKADAIARRRQLARARDLAERRVADAQRQLDQHQAARSAAEQRWRDLWRASGLSPRDPAAMVEWLAHHDAWQNQRDQERRAAERLADVEQRLREIETRLAQALPGVAGDTAAVWNAARRRAHEARRLAARREQLRASTQRQRQELALLEKQSAEVQRDLAAWGARWNEALTRYHFDPAWDIHLARKILAELAVARQEHLEHLSLQERVDDMSRESDEFARRAAQIQGLLAPELAGRSALLVVEELGQRLDDAVKAEATKKAAQQRHEQLGRQIAAKDAQLAIVKQEQSRWLALAGVDDPLRFPERAARAKQRHERSALARRLESDLLLIREKEDEAVFEAELAAADPDALEPTLLAAEAELQAARAAQGEAVGKAAVARKDLERLESETETAALAIDLECQRGELAVAVDRWAPLVLARQVLRDAAARFEREHQPALLGDVGALFDRLTAGRYVALRRKPGAENALAIERRDGALLEPKQLSTGAREQLYLAIRLAYARHYCRGAEPLPLVLDDVLVNFDDARARRAAEVLRELSGELQVVFLTCKGATLALFEEINPGAASIRLEPREHAAPSSLAAAGGVARDDRSLFDALSSDATADATPRDETVAAPEPADAAPAAAPKKTTRRKQT